MTDQAADGTFAGVYADDREVGGEVAVCGRIERPHDVCDGHPVARLSFAARVAVGGADRPLWFGGTVNGNGTGGGYYGADLLAGAVWVGNTSYPVAGNDFAPPR